jgi:hypothetical protein
MKTPSLFVIIVSILLCLIFISTSLVVEAAPKPPIYNCAGTYQECGFSIGRQAKDQITARFKQADVQRAQNIIINTKTGQDVFFRFMQRVEEIFPEILDEFEGLALGSGLSYNEIFLLNALDEFGALESGGGTFFKPSPSCTDILKNSVESPGFGHNEDNVKWIENLTYFVNATIYTDSTHTTIAERFISFAYPGMLAGVQFGWNIHGLVFSDNYIFTNYNEYDESIPSNIKARGMYRCKSVSEMTDMQTAIRGSTGYNWNAASTSPTISNNPNNNSNSVVLKYTVLHYESDPFGPVAVHRIASAASAFGAPIPKTKSLLTWWPHANDFTVLNSTNEQVDESSVARRQRALQLALTFPNQTVSTISQITTILGDTTNPTFPIYRKGDTKIDNYIATLATVVYDLKNKKAFVWHENPALNDHAFEFPLW